MLHLGKGLDDLAARLEAIEAFQVKVYGAANPETVNAAYWLGKGKVLIALAKIEELESKVLNVKLDAEIAKGGIVVLRVREGKR